MTGKRSKRNFMAAIIAVTPTNSGGAPVPAKGAWTATGIIQHFRKHAMRRPAMAQILQLRGAAAFSASRLDGLLKRVRRAVPGLAGLVAEHWYFVEVDRALGGDELARLKDLLGVPAQANDFERSEHAGSPLPGIGAAGEVLLVTPRLGT